ncbi:hypothetical protein K437DRAFT_10258 [Tilletiaria anomala UBC 951]|uniref:Uncharacterized protein n=1 Tax=Tilletiaria anomala (strain ATCC 24038 / CBS 436.72 / UBC 951) TaxID=1037660 RepID=A0A066VCQ0_TILAU|nr:uncharacterized protein K437DRAFT_10258 [Tilletiaria anomala UBC 951]KDN39522.1 hypothetical protein K437DRAFT_10258 [Tilletiaria anomala UBC 951]
METDSRLVTGFKSTQGVQHAQTPGGGNLLITCFGRAMIAMAFKPTTRQNERMVHANVFVVPHLVKNSISTMSFTRSDFATFSDARVTFQDGSSRKMRIGTDGHAGYPSPELIIWEAGMQMPEVRVIFEARSHPIPLAAKVGQSLSRKNKAMLWHTGVAFHFAALLQLLPVLSSWRQSAKPSCRM